MFYGNLEKELSLLIRKSVEETFQQIGLPDTALPSDLTIELEMPKTIDHGDISTNVAMRLCRVIGKQPLEIAALAARKIQAQLESAKLQTAVEKVEVKEPGFINFFLRREYLYKVLLDAIRQKERFGSSTVGRSKKINIEFVSANPTGPLTVAHGRQAAIGDSLARILEFCGYDVQREYYINDEGRQIDILGESIRIRYCELNGKPEPFPEDGYQGSYIKTIAQDLKKKRGSKLVGAKDKKIFSEFGVAWLLKSIKNDLKDFNVQFDVWYSQKALRRSGKIDRALGLLKEKGLVYDQDGATWFASTRFGDDKDRVVYKSDSSYTYLAPDIAYHLDKYRRKFRKLIDIWGPDHHGYIPRIKAAVQALGYDKGSLSVLIVQLATISRSGKPLRMSTRTGEFITLREVIDEVGKDATRFCFMMRKLDSHLNFDLDIVKSQSLENPVYYIQYAYARICSIMKYSTTIRRSRFNSKLLKEEEELNLLRMIRQFPVAVQNSATFLEPYGIISYLQQLAGAFHSFYDKIRVVSDDTELTQARIVLVECVRTVVANGLRLLGVSVPEKM